MGEMEEEAGCAATLPLPGELAPGLGSSPWSSPVQTSWLYGLRKQSPERGRTYPLSPAGLRPARTASPSLRDPADPDLSRNSAACQQSEPGQPRELPGPQFPY